VLTYRKKQGDEDVGQCDTKSEEIEPDAYVEIKKQISDPSEHLPFPRYSSPST